MLEKDVVRQILNYLTSIGATAGKIKTVGIMRHGRFTYDRYLMRGKADLECFWKGVMYAIECKRPGEKIIKGSDQDKYRELFHAPPLRIFIEADSVEKVTEIIN